MSQETTDNFWTVFNAWSPEPPKAVLFRLYYQDDGSVICYSNEDIPGNYIQVDPETYARGRMNVRVVGGRIVEIKQGLDPKLTPNSESGTKCHPTDVTVIVSDKTYTNWNRKSHEHS